MTRPLLLIAGSSLVAAGVISCSGLLGLEDRSSTSDANVTTTNGDTNQSGADASTAEPEAASPLADTIVHNSWTTLGPMPNARRFLASAVVDGRAYVIGGLLEGLAPAHVVDVYEPLRGVWRSSAPSERNSWAASTVVLGGKIYVFGGSYDPAHPILASTAVDVYDPATDDWTSLPPMPAPRTAATATAFGAKAYLIGGFIEEYTDRVDIYDPANGSWTEGARMSKRRDHSATAVVDGAAYVFGGTVSLASPFALVEKYDFAKNEWTTRAPMRTPRYDATCAEVNGIIYVIGGNLGSDIRVATVEAYDPATDTWTRRAEMPTARDTLTSFVLDGRVYVAGGRDDSGTEVNTVEVFTP